MRVLTHCVTARDLPAFELNGPTRAQPPLARLSPSGITGLNLPVSEAAVRASSPRTRPPLLVPLSSRKQPPPQDPAAPRVERPPPATHPARLCLPLPRLPAPEEAPDLLQAPRVAGSGPWPSGGQWEALGSAWRRLGPCSGVTSTPFYTISKTTDMSCSGLPLTA